MIDDEEVTDGVFAYPTSAGPFELPPVKKIPVGERALPEPKKAERPARYHAELCGSGDKNRRHRRLDEIDGFYDG